MGVLSKLRYSFVGEKIRSLIPQKIVNSLFHLPLAFLAVIFYRYPARKLKVIGITGTDGKTTVVSLIYHILKKAGLRVAMVCTVSAKIGNKEIKTGLHVTAPNPWLLQKLLREMVESKTEYVVLEATSHGLDQHRLLGCNFQVGVITNVTHEHLDYHKTYENYVAAKAKLLKSAKVAIINKDDESYKLLNSKFEIRNSKLVTYGIKEEADFTPKKFGFKTDLPGEYNLYNCLAAIAAASSLGISEEVIRKAVSSFKGVEGRMEEIDKGQDFTVIIDFAHTPNGLEQVLRTLHQTREMKHEKLIVVFGCAGLRDRTKRPIMGKIAARYADFIVLTAEDPRTEDVKEIIDQIAQGCLAGGAKELDYLTSYTSHLTAPCFFRIPDRQQAITFAIQKLAKKGDVVIICGKGHERSMCFGRTEYPWSDREAAKKALNFPKLLKI